MKKIFLLFLLLISSPGFAGEVVTLRQCFDFTLNENETIALQEEKLRWIEGVYFQSLGSILPQITAYGTETLQDDSAAGDATSAVSSTFTRFSRPEIRVNATQPIFSGFREWHALKAATSQRKAEKNHLEAVKRAVSLEVAQAFYTFLQLKEEEKAYKGIREALEKRVSVMKQRTSLGQSRTSELVTTETELALAQAAETGVQGALENVRETLSFLTGHDISDVMDDLELPPLVMNDQAVESIVEKRPDYIAAKQELESARSTELALKAIRYPSLSAQANYYPYRVGFQKDIKWDALFQLSVPLFRGGSAHGQVQQAKSQYAQAKLTFEQTRRSLMMQFKQSRDRYHASHQQMISLEQAQEKGEENYRLIEREYQRGITNNLEVLSALKQWEDLKRQYWQAYAQTKVDWLQLKVAMGEPIP